MTYPVEYAIYHKQIDNQLFHFKYKFILKYKFNNIVAVPQTKNKYSNGIAIVLDSLSVPTPEQNISSW